MMHYDAQNNQVRDYECKKPKGKGFLHYSGRFGATVHSALA